MNKDDIQVILQGFVGIVSAFLLALPTTVLALLVLQALDVITGLMAGYITKTLDSRVSYVGLMRKALVLVAVAGSSYLGAALQLPSPELLPTAIAGFYSLHEGLSILENLVRSGVPLPEQLKNAMRKDNDV